MAYRKTNTRRPRGRPAGYKNLKKVDGGFVNQNNVFISAEERKRYDYLRAKANKQREKLIAQFNDYEVTLFGEKTGQTLKDLRVMGAESEFIITEKHKLLQEFADRKSFDIYLGNLERVTNPNYLSDRVKLYKRNYSKAIDRAFGDQANDIKMKVRTMKHEDFLRVFAAEEEALAIGYIYGSDEAEAKLNGIRAALGLKQKPYIETETRTN